LRARYLVVSTSLPFIAAVLLVLATSVAAAAEAGIYTLVDGDTRVLRGTTWFKLAPGARADEGDIVEAGEHGNVQLELSGGRTVNLHGPAAFLATGILAADNKQAAPTEITIQHGWLKCAASGKQTLRLRLPTMGVDLIEAIVVLNVDARDAEMFVESGTAKVTAQLARAKTVSLHEAAAGEYLSRTAAEAPLVAARPTNAFISGMPRAYRDPLPVLAPRVAKAAPELEPLREISLAEAEPWLSGSNRKAFLKRFAPRLSDAAFRAGIIARPAAFPEWDRVLRPERYRPKDQDSANR